MHTRDQACSRAELVVPLQEQLPGFFVQRGLGVRVDQEAFDGGKDVLDAVSGFPVFLERVDANFAGA